MCVIYVIICIHYIETFFDHLMCSSHLRSFRVGVLWQGPARGSWSPAAAPAAAAPRRCRRSRWPRPAAPR